MDTSREEFLQQFKFGLVQVVYEWAKAKPFYEITNLTDVQEGIEIDLLRPVYQIRVIVHPSRSGVCDSIKTLRKC